MDQILKSGSQEEFVKLAKCEILGKCHELITKRALINLNSDKHPDETISETMNAYLNTVSGMLSILLDFSDKVEIQDQVVNALLDVLNETFKRKDVTLTCVKMR